MRVEPGELTICFGSSAEYFPLLNEAMESILSYAEFEHVRFCVGDLGLEESQKTWLNNMGVTIGTPRWHLPVSEDVLKSKFFNRMTVYGSYSCPWLPEYYPGTKYLMWADVDIWLQNKEGILWHLEALRRGADVVLTPELDRSCPGHGDFTQTWYDNLSAVYGHERAYAMLLTPWMNGGLGAAPTDGVFWRAWQSQMLEHGHTGVEMLQMVTLQYIVVTGQVRAHFLPSTCNWMCATILPALDLETGELVTPMYPHEKINIVHMHSGTWRGEKLVNCTNGAVDSINLRYGNMKIRRLAAQDLRDEAAC